jgi:DnaJ-class molecular chaperone
MAEKDPYQILGVARTATADEIKNAYRKLAKKHHPDLNPGSAEAERKFKEINRANDLLGTAETRAKFDRGEIDASGAETGPMGGGSTYRHTQRPSGGAGRYTQSFGQGMDEDLFASIFGKMGGGMGGPGGGSPRDELYEMEIDLKDTVAEFQRELTLPTGKRLSVRVPAGVAEGTRLRFVGQAGSGGDAYVEIRVRPDPRFERQDQDLRIEVAVPLMEAVFGGELRVPTLEGAVMLKVPPRANSGTRLRVPGKGVFDRKSGKRGDEIVTLRVQLPEKIDAELEAALKAWQARTAAPAPNGGIHETV